MAKKDETPETTQDSGSETGAEQGAIGAQPADIQQSPSAKEESKDARMWAMFCHLAGLLIDIVSPSNMRKNQPKRKGTGNVILC